MQIVKATENNNKVDGNSDISQKSSLNAEHEFYDKKLARAKELLTEMIVFSAGWEMEDNFWIIPYLIEITGIIETVEPVCVIGDFTNELQSHIFTQSFDFMGIKDKWIKDTLFDSADLSEYKKPSEAVSDEPAPQNNPPVQKKKAA